MKFYEILLSANNSKVGNLWNNLDESQRQSLLEIDFETDNLENSIAHDVVFLKVSKMALEVVRWSKAAVLSFDKIFTHLSKDWGEFTTKTFIKKGKYFR